MITIDKTEVVGWEHAIRGLRNPMNSWDKSDSYTCAGEGFGQCSSCNIKCVNNGELVLGENDLSLMKKLSKAGTDHRKFMRMIVVYCDITAPMYWWKEFDTYKVGTVRNSCSTMHKIHSKEFTLDDFSHEHFVEPSKNEPCFIFTGAGDSCNFPIEHLGETIEMLNLSRKLYLDTKDKRYWWQMIQLLPSSYNQKSTVMLNYEVLSNMYHSRKSHKLDEWREFCKWIKTLPYSELITGEEK